LTEQEYDDLIKYIDMVHKDYFDRNDKFYFLSKSEAGIEVLPNKVKSTEGPTEAQYFTRSELRSNKPTITPIK